MDKKYKVWTCKIIISDEVDLPPGFDYPPRMAAQKAIEGAGFKVLMNSSGWGGSLSKSDIEFIDRNEGRMPEIYVAGRIGIGDDLEH